MARAPYYPTHTVGAVYITGNASEFQVQGDIPHGKTTRGISVRLTVEQVEALAAVLKHTRHPGHASWHMNNPKSPAGVTCYGCCHGELCVYTPADYTPPVDA